MKQRGCLKRQSLCVGTKRPTKAGGYCYVSRLSYFYLTMKLTVPLPDKPIELVCARTW